jgi:alkyl hydroperoxide reductase subunit F
MYDLIIIGGGPAGLTAAAYAINKRLETLVVSEDLGGKINYRLSLKGIQGYEVITGSEVVDKFKHQLEYLNFAHQTDRVTQVTPEGKGYSVLTQSNKRHQARAIIVATGATPKRLDVPGEKQLIGKGVSYSAISHAQLYIDREPAIVGSNRRALYAAAEMANIARQVHLILPDKGEMDSPLGKRLRAHPKVKIYELPLKEVRGAEGIESIVVGDKTIKVDGLFVEIGLTPGSKVVADLGITDAAGRIIVDNKCATKQAGLYAAGDVTDVFIEQVLVAVGEGAKAALSAYEYLLNQ